MQLWIDADNCQRVLESSPKDPDFFSIDIDGVDYHVVARLLERGLRPKVFCCEYNSAFGPKEAVTIEYKADFGRHRVPPSGLYYGASITAWRKLLERYSYTFVGIESNGINAFFVQRDQLQQLPEFQNKEFIENFVQFGQYKQGWEAQRKIIEKLPVVRV